MKLFIPKDYFTGNPKPPRLFLCTTGKKIIQELPSYDESLDGKWGSYSEISFSIDRQYVDVLTGETKVHPAFDKAEGLRKVYMENMGYFVIQDPDSTYGENDSKTLSCFSSEYETANKYLENFRINTGEVDSKEVIYESSQYGDDATADQMYKLARYDGWDSNAKYYHRVYTDNDSYNYEQIQIADENVYKSHFGEDMHPEDILYIHGYANVQFYNPYTPELSLLHLIFAKIPEWKIGNVDYTLWHKERQFDEDRIAVYDFLMNDVQDTFSSVVEWDTVNNVVNFYEEAEDGITEDNTVQTRWETDVFVSRDNLASQININYSTDNIKTKLKVSGADDLDIREVNLGKNYIMNLSYYHTLDWMEPDLFKKYDDYLETVEKYKPQYTTAMQNWVGAYNKWNDFMNAVPAEGNVVLVGDPFKKLYCVYGTLGINAYLYPPYVTQIGEYEDKMYYNDDNKEEINKETLSDGDVFFVNNDSYTVSKFVYEAKSQKFRLDSRGSSITEFSLVALKKQLGLYHIDEDIDATKTDNILLKLKDKNSNTATIRIYDPKQKATGSYDKNARYYVYSSKNKKYTLVKISDESVYNSYDGTTEETTLYTNNYTIQVVFVNSQSGITSDPVEYTINQWIEGKLTAETMALEDYTVQLIGTMGAYFVLAKDETVKANLKDYGVRLLQEKHDTYTTIFQAQTEQMFSHADYQCVVSDDEPAGVIAEGTRWLDTDSNPMKLYQYIDKQWVEVSASISEEEQFSYENYQRYINNYEKLQAVQEVLLEKKKQATYMRDGYTTSDRIINIDLYTKGDDGVLRYNGQTLESDLHRIAEAHFVGYTVARKSIDQILPLYTFTTSFDPDNVFAVYLKGKTPYVAYADSQGVYQAKKDWITEQTSLEKFFDEDQWVRLSPFIREDEFSDSNFLLTGYESEEERLQIYNELVEAATKELNTLCQPSLEFSMDMANILALPEFKSLFNQFQLGNFVRVHIRDGYVKRARLLEVHLNFNDLSDFSCGFGNLVTTKSEVDKHAELLAQAVTAGKQVATAAGDWQRAVDKSNKLEEEIANGLQNVAIEVGKASGQAISWNEQGIRCRKLIDGTTDQYEDAQIAIINNKIVFTNDGWKTSKAALGQFTLDINGDGVEESMYGLIADAVVSGYVKGSVIEGGSLKIGGTGGTFIVNEDGSVQILAADAETPIYATKNDMDLVSQARQFHIELSYDNSTIFGKPDQTCTITCKVYKWDEDITSKLPLGTTFTWLRNGLVYKTTSVPTFTVRNEDIDVNAQFACQVTFDETKIT